MSRGLHGFGLSEEPGPRGGIAGVVALGDRGPDPSIVESMMRSLAGRLGHAWGFYVDEHVGFGVTRPSVTECQHPDHPATNEDGSVRVVLDGTIRNARDIRRELLASGHRFRSDSSAEVIAHAWEEYGDQCLGRFAGLFAWAVWDQHRRQLFLARNNIGGKPLYCAVAESWLIFASDWRAVIMHPALTRQQDVVSVPRSMVIDVDAIAASLADEGRVRAV